MPRVCLTINDLSFLVSHRLSIVSALRDANCIVYIAAPPGDEHSVHVLKSLGAIHIPWGIDRRSTKPVIESQRVAQIVYIYRHLRPDIVHHVTPKPVLYGSIAARLTGVRRVINAISGLGTAFTGDPTLATRASMILHRLAHKSSWTRTIVQNGDDHAFLIKNGIAPPKQIRLIRGSGVAPTEYRPAQSLTRDPSVLVPARMLTDKGIAEAVEAARLLNCSGTSIHLHLAGEPDPGNPRTIDSKQLRAWSDGTTVRWRGRIDNMAAFLPTMRIACLPSYREGLPKALIEAASCGLPIVTCDVPGCREIVRHGDNGLLVPPRDPYALAAALKTLLDDYDLCVRMGQRGRERVIAEFSLDRVVRQHMEIYQELLGDRWPTASTPCSP